ncbi:ATPase [Croceicoccus sp. F390]|uniref:ATPase n=1 Tax=Croceicoccus esteveae TaxID=3075597 RepID=A0ABU2ZFG4_9SPHN|nr:ATPase [Croceicoccus sp. F390]MDT0574818.1 ATPase [Croceicoccus sp. F390]
MSALAKQIALPLLVDKPASGLLVGAANANVIRSCDAAGQWPFHTAVLVGPQRSGRSTIARWFSDSGRGIAMDDAALIDAHELFHVWNRAQQTGTPLLLVGPSAGQEWSVGLPDLASRIGAAARLVIDQPDEAMLAQLLDLHARKRGLVLSMAAVDYLVPRCTRSFAAVEELVATLDRLGLERKMPANLSIWRDALSACAMSDAGG